jgi:hypothetical protein
MGGANQLIKVNANGNARIICPRQVVTENLNIRV